MRIYNTGTIQYLQAKQQKKILKPQEVGEFKINVNTKQQ